MNDLSNNQSQQLKNEINKSFFKKSIECNLLVIDNFYNNPLETRNYILSQEFNVTGNYPGRRTQSYANEELKKTIEVYISNFTGKIIDWPTGKNSYNGAFQFTTSHDRSWIHNDSCNNWAGVLFLTPNAPLSSGTGIFTLCNSARTIEEAKKKGIDKLADEFSQDYTKWELVDRIGNVFNRLLLFRANQFHVSLDYFGTNKYNGRLFQVFFFTTER